jgi:serine/threonine protein kinase
MPGHHWNEQGESPYPFEREALRWVREWFPDREPWRAYARFTFPGCDGIDREIDLLVAGPTGCFLIEFKGYEGRITGDSRDLIATSGSRRQAFEHPRRLLKSKIDKLVETLGKTAAYRDKGARPPFIEPIVFFHHADVLEISPPGDAGVVLRDRDEPRVDGLRALILERRAPWLRPLFDGEKRIDKPAAKVLSRALEEIIYMGPRAPQVAGSWQLASQPSEATGAWSDFEATHKLTREQRTVRVYIAPKGRELDRHRLENNARLEFEALRTFDHPGVLRAYELDECDLGFAICFEHLKDAVRLDHFMLTRGAQLDFASRVDLMRQLCEAVAAAHDRGVAHRGLVPSAVLVASADSGRPTVKIRNWHRRIRTDAAAQAGLQTFGGETISDTTAFAADLVDAERAYLAPELRMPGEPGGIAADIFSLGALACLVFSGRAPGQSAEEVEQVLARQQHLSLSQDINGASASLEQFVARSAHRSPLERATTARELIECLDRVQDELARPELPVPTGPDDLVKDMVLDVGNDRQVTVVRRLGSGGTAVGFEVAQGDSSFVLKVARSPELNDRLKAEAEALRSLQHGHIVNLDAILDVGSCTALLLRPLGTDTLHDYLKREGALGIDFLERWGDQLLWAVEHLEDRGRSHRDIKPGNIAIAGREQKKAREIVLFDFSLAALAPDNLNAGTPGYIDPFLGTGSRRIWDRAGERYAAAVTLYEMTTAVRPVWGDGRTPPHLDKAELPALDADLFPAEVRPGLLSFFQRALHRDASKRFDSATAMRAAWSKALAGSTITVAGIDGTAAEGSGPTIAAALDQAVAGAGVNTIIPALPLSTRAQNALHRLQIDNIEGLLRWSPHGLRFLRGVGRTTQRELVELYQEAHKRFPHVQATVRDAAAAPAGGSDGKRRGRAAKASVVQPVPLVDSASTLTALARSLVERTRSGESRSSDALADYLGLGGAPAGIRPEPGAMQAAAAAHGLTRAAVYIALDGAVKRWVKNPVFVGAAKDVAELLAARGGVAPIAEIGAALAARFPRDDASGPEREAVAGFAVALAVAEAENRAGEHKRFELRRAGGRPFVAATGAEAAAQFAVKLGRMADQLADPSQPVLPSASTCLLKLREIPQPAGIEPLSNERLLSLAAAASSIASLNRRGELYPRGMDALRALKLAQGVVSGIGEYVRGTSRRAFTVEQLRERVAQRYPDALRLPDPPECIAMVREVLGSDVEFDPSSSRFLVRAGEAMTVQTGSDARPTMAATFMGAGPVDARQQTVNRAEAFAREVRAALADRRSLVVGVRPEAFGRAVPRLADSFGLKAVSVDELIISGLRAVCSQRGIDLARIHAADEAWPDGADAARFRAVLDLVRDTYVLPALLQPGAAILAFDWGLAFRYEMRALYDAVRDACGSGAHPGAICVLPADDAEQSIVLDGMQFPEFAPERIIRVPGAWLRLEAA